MCERRKTKTGQKHTNEASDMIQCRCYTAGGLDRVGQCGHGFLWLCLWLQISV